MRSERPPETDEVRRRRRADDQRTDEALASGGYAEPRSWIKRTRDEVASWFGDTGAQRRRQWDEAAGDHTGQGPTRVIDADTRIVEELDQRLTADRALDASDVQVTSRDGVVTLDGAVRTSGGAQRAEALASAVSGVRRVINNLIVV